MLRPRPLATAPASARSRWWPVTVLAALVTVLVVLVVRPAGAGTERFAPVQVGVSSADPLRFAVGVRWPYDGMCSGELRAVVREQRDRVVVRRVERRTGGVSGCARVGAAPGSVVYGDFRLEAPLGRRLVVTGDGEQLPVVTLAY